MIQTIELEAETLHVEGDTYRLLAMKIKRAVLSWCTHSKAITGECYRQFSVVSIKGVKLKRDQV